MEPSLWFFPDNFYKTETRIRVLQDRIDTLKNEIEKDRLISEVITAMKPSSIQCYPINLPLNDMIIGTCCEQTKMDTPKRDNKVAKTIKLLTVGIIFWFLFMFLAISFRNLYWYFSGGACMVAAFDINKDKILKIWEEK